MALDTSMYPKATSVNPLEQVGNALTIQKASIGNQNALLAQKNLELDNQTKQLDLAEKHFNNMNKVIGPLVLKADLSSKDVTGAIADTLAQGLLTPQQAAQTAANMPQDPTQLRDWVKMQYLRTLESSQQVAMAKGQISQINTGANIESVQTNPLTGQVNRVGGNASNIPVEISPDATTTVLDEPTGRNKTVQLRNLFSPETESPVNEVLPPSQSQSSKAMIDAKGGKGAAFTGFSDTEKQARGSAAESYTRDAENVKNAPSTMYNMEQALDSLEQAKTGPGTETANSIKSFLVAFDPTGAANYSFGEGVGAYDKAKKYLVNQAQQLSSTAGPNTDSNLATAIAGSPNTSISKLAAVDLQKAMIALKRLDFARIRSFQEAGMDPGDYQKYSADFGKTIDPRAFLVDMMPKSKVAKIYGSFKSKDDEEKFRETYDMGVELGLIKRGMRSGE